MRALRELFFAVADQSLKVAECSAMQDDLEVSAPLPPVKAVDRRLEVEALLTVGWQQHVETTNTLLKELVDAVCTFLFEEDASAVQAFLSLLEAVFMPELGVGLLLPITDSSENLVSTHSVVFRTNCCEPLEFGETRSLKA